MSCLLQAVDVNVKADGDVVDADDVSWLGADAADW